MIILAADDGKEAAELLRDRFAARAHSVDTVYDGKGAPGTNKIKYL